MAEIEFCLLHRQLTVFLDGKVALRHSDMARLPLATDVLKALGFKLKEGHVFKDWEQRLSNTTEHDWMG
jgi:hypothetical protein